MRLTPTNTPSLIHLTLWMVQVYNWSNGSEAQMVYTEFLNRFLHDLPELAAMKHRHLDANPHANSNNKTVTGRIR